jgi:fatty-acyl-CoA synthase
MEPYVMDFNLAQIHEAIAAAIPDRECIVFRDRRLCWSEVADRSRRLANLLAANGLGVRRERSKLEPWQSGQDHLALYLYNGNEYLEGMLGGFKARVAPFNVNYRYVEDELIYLLRDSRAHGIVYHASFAPLLAKVRPAVPELALLLQVADESGNALLPGALDYEEALAASPASLPRLEHSPDDLYMLYTGGTTGMPKGVLWRQADIFVTAIGGRRPDGSEFESLDAIVERARRGKLRVLPAPPFMHGASHWSAFNTFHAGGTVVIQRDPRRLDPEDILDTIDRESVSQVLIVGDAFARPLVDHLRNKPRPLPSLQVVISGGAPLNRSLKAALLELLPHVSILDAVGASETGRQGQAMTTRGGTVSTGTFEPVTDNVILSEDLTHVLEPGSVELGWLAKAGRVPLGYLGDPEKSARTFPTIGGRRYSLPGDRARLRADGTIELHGRDSVTINSGGEKIFAEEVEHALKHHPAVYDAIVVGRPSERWGEEVVAIVKLRDGSVVPTDELLAECARHIARFKLPKAVLVRDEIVRSPSGKADYRWARAEATRS